jgi:predicted nucleic acid-binding protein
MASYLADTAILVDLLRGYSPARAWLDSLPVSEVAVSVITAAELLAGCRNSNEQRIVEQELALYRILWLSEPISQTALEWYRLYHLSHGLGFLDCLIGATAYQHGLRLDTVNDRHFRMLPGLVVERPY